MAGWLTNGTNNYPDTSITGAETISVDTHLPNGQSPQTASVTTAQLGLGGFANGLTAHAGGGQANALQLGYGTSEIATVATTADSVALPPAVINAQAVVTNLGVNSMQVFGNGTDTINSVATGTGVALAAGATALYRCTVSGPGGNWVRFSAS